MHQAELLAAAISIRVQGFPKLMQQLERRLEKKLNKRFPEAKLIIKTDGFNCLFFYAYVL